MAISCSFWETFGKASAVLTLAATAYGLWIAMFPSKEDVVASVYYQRYVISPDLITAIDGLRAALYETEITKALATIPDLDVPEEKLEKIGKNIYEVSKSKWTPKFQYDIEKYRSFTAVIIKNTGDKAAKNIHIDTPLNGVVLVTRNDNTQSVSNFNQSIKVGDLRANNSVTLSIWSEEGMSEHYEEDFNLTHENGLGSFNFSTRVTGFDKFLVNYKYGILWVLLMGLWFLISAATRKPNNTSSASQDVVESKDAKKGVKDDAQ